MDKNMLTAIVLSIAVVFGVQFLVREYFAPEPKKDAVKTEEKAAAEKAAPAVIKADQKTTVKKSAKAVSEAKPVKARTEKTVTVENNLYKTVLSSKGASVRQVELKNYKDSKGGAVVLKADDKLPALIMGFDDGLQYAAADFEVKGSDIKLDDNRKSAEVSFEYKNDDISIRRTYTFTQGEYAIAVRDEVKGHDSYFVTLGKNFGVFDKENADHVGPIILKDTELIPLSAKDIKNSPKPYPEKVKWIAQEDKYFASFLVPKGAIEEARAWAKDGDALIGLKLKSGNNSYVLYAGPKDLDILENTKLGIEHIIDFGVFSILARPLFWLLRWIYDLVGNWGWAIVIFTIITRLPFIPIINKGQKSMKKMAELQPKMNVIREQFKNDPQRMQKELMAMYKKNKINPVGGCLPIALQIPFFFALLAILSTAIELRQAPFIWWIKDLAAPDNLFSEMLGISFVIGPLPLVMGATMFIMQKMTPSGGDPMQQKMMMLLPLVFTFMFLNFSSGLVLFWLVSNILSIIQQFFVNRHADAQLQP
jgi:YidC/Oxa1 family membrane protein insertase